MKILKTFHVTEAQDKRLKEFCQQYDGGQSQLIRDALAKFIPDFPDDMPRQGTRTDLNRE